MITSVTDRYLCLLLYHTVNPIVPTADAECVCSHSAVGTMGLTVVGMYDTAADIAAEWTTKLATVFVYNVINSSNVIDLKPLI